MSTPCESTEKLVEQTQGLVRSLASRIHRRLPPYLDLEDLIAYGQVGLLEAAKEFDPGRGIQFSTYAYYRIRGAIYDGLSKMTWFSRAYYNRVRFDQMANEFLSAETEQGEQPDEATAESDLRWLRDISRALAVVYLTTHSEWDDTRQQARLVDRSTPAPPNIVIRREQSQKLRELIDGLPSEAATLIRATYFEGLTLQEAGRKLGISKSWASRLHAKTLQRLARSLRLLGVST